MRKLEGLSKRPDTIPAPVVPPRGEIMGPVAPTPDLSTRVTNATVRGQAPDSEPRRRVVLPVVSKDPPAQPASDPSIPREPSDETSGKRIAEPPQVLFPAQDNPDHVVSGGTPPIEPPVPPSLGSDDLPDPDDGITPEDRRQVKETFDTRVDGLFTRWSNDVIRNSDGSEKLTLGGKTDAHEIIFTIIKNGADGE